MQNTPITVAELSGYIKSKLEGDVLLSHLCVKGEISNFKRHSSGHCYFTLKDESAVISAVMFRGDAGKLRFEPESGMKVILFGRVSLFAKSGQYQIYVNDMQPDGVGALFIAYEQLKEKLRNEGLFEPAHKKTLPKYPKVIALMTSKTGAAIQDMIRVISTRYRAADILVCPVTVQGDTAADSIVDMIGYINKHKLADVIIGGRGGGSIEDLWCFNEERVARAIFASKIPYVSAVGHEPDVTISDFVADVRGATPSNAAEIVAPDGTELMLRMAEWRKKMYFMEMKKVEMYRQKLTLVKDNKLLSSPYEYLNERAMTLNLIEQKLAAAMDKRLTEQKNRYIRLTAMLDALSPLKVVSRGYSLASKDGKIVKSVKLVEVGDTVTTRLSDGYLVSSVTDIKKLKGSK